MNKKMRKGIHPVIPFLIVLAIVLGLEYFYVSYFIRSEFIAGRYLRETPIIAEGDRLETYVRSFKKATELSLIQSIYDTGNGTIILESDFDSIYDNNTGMPYWRIYDKKYVPGERKIELTISKISLAYTIDYFNEYQNFPKNPLTMRFPEKYVESEIKTKKDDGEDSVSLNRGSIIFESYGAVHIIREFEPEAKIITKFGEILDMASTLVNDEEPTNCPSACINDNETKTDAQGCLDVIAPKYEEKDIEVKMTLLSFTNPDGLPGDNNGIIKVEIYEENKNYPVYVYRDDSVQTERLGVSFLMKVGELKEYDPNQVVVSKVPNFRDCPSYCKLHDCESDLGVISERNESEICPFLETPEVEYKGCEDTDDGIKPEIPGTTKVFIDSTEDAEKDSCNSFTNTLTEYYCLAPPGARRASIQFDCNRYCEQEHGEDYSGVCAENSKGEGYCLCSKCKLKSVKINPDCSGGGSPYCEQGEEIKVDVEYNGSECPNPAYIQVDANDTDCSICDQDRDVCEDDICSMRGIDIKCFGITPPPVYCSKGWTIPSYPLDCWDKVIEAGISTLRDDYECNDGRPYGWIKDAEGSFTFASCIDSDRSICEGKSPDCNSYTTKISCEGHGCIWNGLTYGDNPHRGGNTTNTTNSLKDYCTDDTLTEYFCDEHDLKEKSYDCDVYCKGIDPDSIGKCFEDEEEQGECRCLYKLTVETVLDIDGNPVVPNVLVTVDGEIKSDPSGIVEYLLPVGDHTIEVEHPKGTRPLSHFWDHDCHKDEEGWYDDTTGLPVGTYDFKMFTRPKTITAYYKSFTHITDSVGNLDTFEYDGETISGYLVDEKGNSINSKYHRCDGCTKSPCKEGFWDRDVILEYSTDGGKTWKNIGTATADRDDGSWSLDWSCSCGSNNLLRATYNPTDPKDWYYVGTDAEIEIDSSLCPCKLTVFTHKDISGVPISGIDVSVNGDMKTTDALGKTEFMLKPGTHSITVDKLSDIFSHFWDHDCDEDNEGWYLDTVGGPVGTYDFNMFVRPKTITAYYKTFTKITDFAYDDSTISGKLLDEHNDPIAEGPGNYHPVCEDIRKKHEVPVDRNVKLEYFDGSWHEIPGSPVKSSTVDGSWALDWDCVAGSTKIKASYNPTNWYYVKTSDEIEIVCLQKLTVETAVDVIGDVVPNVLVTVDGKTKSDPSGIVEYFLPVGIHTVEVENPVGTRRFSHFWDHDCDEDNEGWYLDTVGGPVGTYDFNMFVRPKTITAYYKSFTHITDSVGNLDTFEYDGETISGYLVDEKGEIINSNYHRCDICTEPPCEKGFWGKNIKLEYSTDGGGSWEDMDTVTADRDDGSWSLDWSCSCGSNNLLRASYNPTDPKDWYYMGTDAQIDVDPSLCPCKLTVSTKFDISNAPLPGVDVTVNGDTQTTGITGKTIFMLTPGSYDITVDDPSVDLIGVSRDFSHFWDHDCHPTNLGWFYDPENNPYPFTMYSRERSLTAYYKTSTKITEFNYDGLTISGKLLDESDNPIYEDHGNYHPECEDPTESDEVPINRDVKLEYFDGSWHEIPGSPVKSSTVDGSWALDWDCVLEATKIRASYSPTNWYYLSTSAEIEIDTTFTPSKCTSCPPPCGCKIDCGDEITFLSTKGSHTFGFTLDSPMNVKLKMYPDKNSNYNLYINWTEEVCPVKRLSTTGFCGPQLPGDATELCSNPTLPVGTYYFMVSNISTILSPTTGTYNVSLDCSSISPPACEDYSWETPIDAEASSELREMYNALKAIDGNPWDSRWYSQPDGPPQWIYFDLGEIKCVNSVRITLYEEDLPMTIDIQVSDDAESWTTIVNNWVVPVGHEGWAERSFAETTGRYIRLYETAFPRVWGECTEFEAYAGRMT